MKPVVVAVVFVGLFGVALLVGYVGGQAFLTPATTTPQRIPRPVPTAPSPRPTPPQAPPPQQVQPAPAPQPSTPAPAQPAPAPQAPQTAPQSPTAPPAAAPSARVLYRVQVGAFLRRENAETRAAELRERGFEAYINLTGGLYRVQVGAFSDRENAQRVAQELRAVGYEVLITN